MLQIEEKLIKKKNLTNKKKRKKIAATGFWISISEIWYIWLGGGSVDVPKSHKKERIWRCFFIGLWIDKLETSEKARFPIKNGVFPSSVTIFTLEECESANVRYKLESFSFTLPCVSLPNNLQSFPIGNNTSNKYSQTIYLITYNVLTVTSLAQDQSSMYSVHIKFTNNNLWL